MLGRGAWDRTDVDNRRLRNRVNWFDSSVGPFNAVGATARSYSTPIHSYNAFSQPGEQKPVLVTNRLGSELSGPLLRPGSSHHAAPKKFR